MLFVKFHSLVNYVSPVTSYIPYRDCGFEKYQLPHTAVVCDIGHSTHFPGEAVQGVRTHFLPRSYSYGAEGLHHHAYSIGGPASGLWSDGD